MLSEPYDSANAVLLSDGVDSSKATLDQIMGAIEKIGKANDTGQFRRFTGNDYVTDLAKGNVWAALAYSGDLVQLKSDNPNLEFVYPEEGRGALHGQHDAAGQGGELLRRRDDDELRLRAGGGRQDRRLRQLHLAGQGDPGDPDQERSGDRRERADLPA
jgi:hypothetical protein